MVDDGAAGGQIAADRDPISLVVLATCFAVAIFAIAMPIVLMNTGYTVLAAPFEPHKQNAETALYLLTIAVFTPAAIFLAWWSTGKVSAAGRGDCLRGLVSTLVIPLGLGLFVVRHSSGLPWGDGIKATLVLGLLWSLLALLAVASAITGKPAALTRFWASARRPLEIAAVVSAAAGFLAMVRLGHVDLAFFAIAAIVSAAITWVYSRVAPRQLSKAGGISFDLIALLVLLLAVPNMVIYESGAGDFTTSFHNYVTEYHQSLFIGAASQVLNGSAELVDTVSQYGIGSIYLVAAFFEVAPIGYLTLGFFEGVLSALVFGLAFGILRMAGVSRLLAAAAMGVAVVALVWGTEYPNGALLQHGAIRFGLPMPLIAAVVASVRWPRSRTAMKWIALFVIGISSVWALEAFLYISATAAALLAIWMTWVPAPERIRRLVTVVLAIVGAWVVTQVAFALITLVASGSLPDWGLYLTYLREFLTGGIGDLTYDMSPWSPGLAVFFVYVLSAVAIASLVLTRREFTATRQPAFLALAGLAGYGAVLFSYFDNRSLDHILPYVSLPALMLVTIWLGLLLDRSAGFSPRTRMAGLAAALLLASVSVSTVWTQASARSSDSLLAYVIPGSTSVGDGFHRIWNPPALKPGAAAGQQLIERWMPDTDEVPVITEPDLDNEILARADRANQLRITDAKEASWVPGPHLPEVEEAATSLGTGDRMLVDKHAVEAALLVENDPAAALAGPDQIAAVTGLQAIQVRALAWVLSDYRLEKVAGPVDGISVVELKPR